MNQVVRFLRATLRYGLRVLGVIAVVALLLVAFVGFTTRRKARRLGNREVCGNP